MVAAAGAYFAYDWYQLSRLAGSVRRSFAARRYDEARGPLKRWIRQRPRSAEAQYYRAWLALVDDQPSEAVEAIDQAGKLGFDPDRLKPLTGIYQARPARSTRPSRSFGRRSTGSRSPRSRSPGAGTDLPVDLPAPASRRGDRAMADPGPGESPALPVEQRGRLTVRWRARRS